MYKLTQSCSYFCGSWVNMRIRNLKREKVVNWKKDCLWKIRKYLVNVQCKIWLSLNRFKRALNFCLLFLPFHLFLLEIIKTFYKVTYFIDSFCRLSQSTKNIMVYMFVKVTFMGSTSLKSIKLLFFMCF